MILKSHLKAIFKTLMQASSKYNKKWNNLEENMSRPILTQSSLIKTFSFRLTLEMENVWSCFTFPFV